VSLDLLADLIELFAIEAREVEDPREADRLRAIADELTERFNRQLLRELRIA
jgi:hypothetical protein